MPVQALDVPRAEFSVEDPWAIPPQCTLFALRRATDGGAPRQATAVAVYCDDELLTIVVRADDDAIVASMLEHDEPLWKEDVVEAFLAPAASTAYYELEVNPLGTTFDARIDSPDGVRATMQTDLSWTCEGLFAAVRRTEAHTEYVLRVPFAAIGGPPARANFFRVDRSAAHGDEYSAWSPTMKEPADFHVVAAFGDVVIR